MAKKGCMNMDVHRMKGILMLVVGLLVLANVYWSFLSWGAFIGILFVVLGLIKSLMPYKKSKK